MCVSPKWGGFTGKRHFSFAAGSRRANADTHLAYLLRFRPAQLVLMSFVGMIVLGTILLMLPCSTTSGLGLAPVDALFVSTSASCVTGLTVVDVKNDLTLFGKIVMLGLIQVGGLGIMTLATLIAHSMGHRLDLRENLVLVDSLNQQSQEGLLDLIRRIIKYTFAVEGFFAVLLAVHFSSELGFDAIGYGIFHAVSAFCNAGFDLFGNYDSLCKRNDDFFLMNSIALLIILGGIGFTVMADVVNRRTWRRFSLHTKIVLIVNTLVLLAGTLLILGVEDGNPRTIGQMDLAGQLENSFFMSVSCRTAGFNSFDLSVTEQTTQMTMISLMFIGASPLSTGGGVKITTFAVILLSIWATLRGRSDIVLFGRSISRRLRDQSFVIFTMGTLWVVCAGMLLAIVDNEQNKFLEVIFETVSGFGTVGMGIGITPEWDTWGKLILSLTMLAGRVGIMTFMLSFVEQSETAVKYPSEDIMIG